MTTPVKYASKILLFGEYTVIRGSRALAMPFDRFGGEWSFSSPSDLKTRQKPLRGFLEYLRQIKDAPDKFLLDEYDRDLKRGMFFDSNIPVGYGLGSSGALCAAFYDRYAKERIPADDPSFLPALKQAFALLESFFHGSSSGTDPLISYLNRPLQIMKGGRIEQASLPDADAAYQLFLLDTGISRETGPLVNLFMEKCSDADYACQIDEALSPSVEGAIDSFLASRWSDLFQKMLIISRQQARLFTEMIPPPFRPAWRKGLESEAYALKLCGAGGGGMLMGMSSDLAMLEKQFADFSIMPIEW